MSATVLAPLVVSRCGIHAFSCTMRHGGCWTAPVRDFCHTAACTALLHHSATERRHYTSFVGKTVSGSPSHHHQHHEQLQHRHHHTFLGQLHQRASAFIAAPPQPFLTQYYCSPLLGKCYSGAVPCNDRDARNKRTCILNTRSVSTTATKMDLKSLQIAKDKFQPSKDLGTKMPVAEVRQFMVSCLMTADVQEDKAIQLADVLIAADTRGHFSHGLNRLEMYVNDCRSNICNGNATPTITKESVSTALVNGNNGLGPVVGNFCMKLAISKAKETGIGWVCARGSNHYGIAGWYSMQAIDQGMLGMSFTNTSPLVASTRAKEAALGTNPITLAAPAKPGEPFVLDMATCTVAVGKIELSRRKGEKIPEGWGIDRFGKVTTDPAEAMVGALLPLGGMETNSGYKGYGLAMLVEIFCGILSGGQYGPNVRRWMDTTRQADLGQGFVAIDPSFFADGFTDRMADLMDHCRGMEPAEPDWPVLAAGDPERAHTLKVSQEGGITYHPNQVADSWKLAHVLNVPPMVGV